MPIWAIWMDMCVPRWPVEAHLDGPSGRRSRPGLAAALPVWSDLTLNFQSEFAFQCKLWPARVAGDERGSDRGLRSRPALVSKNKLVPISTLQRTGFSSYALAESYDRGSWAASVSDAGNFEAVVTAYIMSEQAGGYAAEESHHT